MRGDANWAERKCEFFKEGCCGFAMLSVACDYDGETENCLRYCRYDEDMRRGLNGNDFEQRGD